MFHVTYTCRCKKLYRHIWTSGTAAIGLSEYKNQSTWVGRVKSVLLRVRISVPSLESFSWYSWGSGTVCWHGYHLLRVNCWLWMKSQIIRKSSMTNQECMYCISLPSSYPLFTSLLPILLSSNFPPSPPPSPLLLASYSLPPPHQHTHTHTIR